MRHALIALTTSCAALLPGVALAHPNHEGGSAILASLRHLLSEPDHLAMLLLPVVVAAGIFFWLRRQRAASVARDARNPRHANDAKASLRDR